ncbi:MAG TPA: zinc-ribbon domain-containing protein [Candidatus Eisenbacteria bacterium]|nr:zinc-ribbon domain-containing protein [Candidatus Eisenbacteria bacterium]
MRCPRCGNDNPDDNRFCGMCGTTLLAPAPPANKPHAVGVGSAPSTRPDTAQTHASTETPRKVPVPAPVPNDPPLISGPSFLGLNDPPTTRVTPSRRASISIDPDSAPPASNLHYLLEDEDDHKGSGLWKFILILIALGLAIGFGYLRWKNQGFAFLNPPAKKPAITQDQPGTAESPASSPGSTPTPAPTNSSTTPSITPEPPPAEQPTPAPPVSANNSSPSGSAPAGTPPTVSASGSTDASKRPDGASASAAPDKPASTPSATPSSEKKAADSAEANNNESDATDDAPAPTKPKAEPPPKPRPTIPADPVSEARKYLYGKGAPQDCDRGVRLLRPAANAGNPKAMVEMGALYSAGLCTPRDLPTAYRWFALALRKQPDNESVQTDLSKLWSEMTQPERQLAIKLTQ